MLWYFFRYPRFFIYLRQEFLLLFSFLFIISDKTWSFPASSASSIMTSYCSSSSIWIASFLNFLRNIFFILLLSLLLLSFSDYSYPLFRTLLFSGFPLTSLICSRFFYCSFCTSSFPPTLFQNSTNSPLVQRPLTSVSFHNVLYYGFLIFLFLRWHSYQV